MSTTAFQVAESVTLGAGGPFNNGELLRLSANKTAVKAQGNALASYGGLLGPIQTSVPVSTGAKANVITSGLAQVKLDSGLSPTFGQVIYPSSATAGLGALTPGSAGAPPIAVVFDASTYAASQIVTAMIIPAAAYAIQPVANWALTDCRYWFIDNENGSDNNIGYIDATPETVFTPAQTSAVALKTSEELRNRLPRVGAMRITMVLYKPRSDGGNYVNKAGANDFIDIAYSGYGYIGMRGSDHTNSAADQVDLGGVTDVVGPNADGSWTVTGPAVGFTYTVAAGSLPAENSVTGRKFKWAGNVTAAARNTGGMVAARSSTTQLDIGRVVTVANGDQFFLQTPGVKFTNWRGSPGVNGTSAGFAVEFGSEAPGLQFCGFRFTAVTTFPSIDGPITTQFLRFDGLITANCNAPWTSLYYYYNEATRFISSRCGNDAHGFFTAHGFIDGHFLSAYHSTTNFWYTQAHPGFQHYTLAGSYFNTAPRIYGWVSSPSAPADESFLGGFVIGTRGTTYRPTRFIAGVDLRGGAIGFQRIDLDGATAGFVINGVAGRYQFGIVTGTLASGNVITMGTTYAERNECVVSSGVAATSAAGDFAPVGATLSLADVALTTYIDSKGNVIQGAGGTTNQLAPAQITGNQNDYNPAGFKGSERVLVNTDASRDINGFVAVVGPRGVKRIINNGAQNVVLKNENAGSTAANRIITPSAADLTLTPSQACDIVYDSVASRWRAFGPL